VYIYSVPHRSVTRNRVKPETSEVLLGHPMTRATLFVPVRVENDENKSADSQYSQYHQNGRVLARFPDRTD
jgi:hypothetical protein